MLERIHKLLQKPGGKTNCFIQQSLIYLLFISYPSLSSFSTVPLQSQNCLGSLSESTEKLERHGEFMFPGAFKKVITDQCIVKILSTKFFIKLFLLSFPWNGDSLLKRNICTNIITFVFCAVMWHEAFSASGCCFWDMIWHVVHANPRKV